MVLNYNGDGHPERMQLISLMNEKIPVIHQKRTPLVKEGNEKKTETLESWMIEEYFVPYQAS